MRLGIILSLVVASQAAFALEFKPGRYVSDSCVIEVTKSNDVILEDGDVIPGRNRLDVSARGFTNTLKGDSITLDKNGNIMDGPGLCMDEVTMGENTGVNITTFENADGSRTVNLTCGGDKEKIQVSVSMRLARDNSIVTYSEMSAVKALFGKKMKMMNCGIVTEVNN